MTISGSMPAAPLRPATETDDPAKTEAGVRVLKMAQEQMQQQADALIQTIEQSGSACTDCQRLDVYA